MPALKNFSGFLQVPELKWLSRPSTADHAVHPDAALGGIGTLEYLRSVVRTARIRRSIGDLGADAPKGGCRLMRQTNSPQGSSKARSGANEGGTKP